MKKIEAKTEAGSPVSASERRVRELAAATWVHQYVEGARTEDRSAFVVTVQATVPPLRGMTVRVRVAHARPGTAWRMARVRMERESLETAHAELARADEMMSRVAHCRHRALLILDALGGGG